MSLFAFLPSDHARVCLWNSFLKFYDQFLVNNNISSIRIYWTSSLPLKVNIIIKILLIDYSWCYFYNNNNSNKFIILLLLYYYYIIIIILLYYYYNIIIIIWVMRKF